MGKKEKLIKKALESPQNLRFGELQKLCEYFDMECRGKEGSHFMYKREKKPKFTQTIQDKKGKAKKYQVMQLINKLKLHNLLKGDQ